MFHKRPSSVKTFLIHVIFIFNDHSHHTYLSIILYYVQATSFYAKNFNHKNSRHQIMLTQNTVEFGGCLLTIT